MAQAETDINDNWTEIRKKIPTTDSNGNLPIILIREYGNANVTIASGSSGWISVDHDTTYSENPNYTRLGAVAVYVGEEGTNNPLDLLGDFQILEFK